MPLYEYECAACGRRFELIRRHADPPVDVCTLCGKGPVNRMFSSPAIQFKGSGWYITDYAQKGKSDGASSNAKGEKPATSDASSSETSNKTETKGDAPAKTESTSPSTSTKVGGSKD